MANGIITGVRVVERHNYLYTREELVSFEVEATSHVKEGDAWGGDDAAAEADRLFHEVTRPTLLKQVKDYAKANRLFRAAHKYVRADVIKHYERLLKREAK